MMRMLLPVGAFLAAMPAIANAAPITPTVTYTPGTVYNTPAVPNYVTTNFTMVGSLITVSFADGTSNSSAWTIAGASNTGWLLVELGDTYGSPWTFTNLGAKAITGFTFNGVPGNTSFDTVPAPLIDSPGSSYGRPFSDVNGPAGLSVAALYTNELEVGGTFYGDEYTKLAVTFGGAGLTSLQGVSYLADTDNVGRIAAAVPEPATWGMMILGMGAVGFAMRRRQKVATRVSYAA